MANEFVARNGINIGTSTTTAILSDGTSIYIKSGGYTYLNTANSAYVSSGGSITATSFLSTYGTNNILLGNSSDMGANSFPFSIAAPSGTTVWPFGIIKAGSAIFRIDNNGNVNSAGSFTGTSGSFSSTMTLTNTATGAGYWTAYVTNGRTALSSLNAGTGYGIFYYQGTAGRDGVDSVDIAFNTTTAATSAVSVKNNGDVKISGNVTATSFSGTITSSQVTTALGFTPVNYTHPAYTSRSISTTGADILSTFTSDSIGSVTGITTRTLTLANLGYTGATNATANTGTVTSVSTTGTVSGLTLTGGTFTTSGTITLGGTLSLTSGNVTTALGFTPYNSTNPSGYITSSGSITGSAGSISISLPGTTESNLVYSQIADNDYFRIRVGGTATNAGWVEIATADDGNEPIYVRQYTGTFTTVTRTATLLDSSGNTSFPGTVTATNFSGTFGGLSISGVTNNVANQIVRTDGSGYANFGWINTVSGSASGTPTRVYCSEDAYLRYYSMSTFTGYVQAAASGSWNINSASIDSNPNRTDGAAYPVVWSNTGATSPNYSCAAVTITSSSGTLQATTLRATSDVIAYYSDSRLKNNLGNITNALDKISKINGIYYTANELAGTFGYTQENVQVGVIAQEIQVIMPEVIKSAPFDTNDDGTSKSGENYITVQYEKIIPLLIEGIKEQKKIVDDQQKLIDDQQKQIDLILSKL
jgi:hypothetical protein